MKRLGSTTKFVGRIFAVVDVEYEIESSQQTWEVAVRSPGVRLILLAGDESTVYLTREFRVETNSWDWRLPGGKVVDSIDDYLPLYLAAKGPGEDTLRAMVEEAARREASEEVGATLAEVEHLGVSVCGATVHWDLHYVRARVAELGDNRPEFGEQIEVHRVALTDALDLIERGEMSEERSAVWLRRVLVPLVGNHVE